MLDPALDTLLLPFAMETLAWPAAGRILFLRARMGPALVVAQGPKDRFICHQTFRPFAQDLSLAGFVLEPEQEETEHFPLVLVLPPRQRDEARYLLAEAVTRAAPGGSIVAAATNTEGARSIEADLAKLTGGEIASLSKNKSRVFWVTHDPAQIDQVLLRQWLDFGTPRRLEKDARFLTLPGLFAWDRIDAGSALLAQHLPVDLAGQGADLGCGFGYLSAEILARCPDVTALDLYEAERVALDLADKNLTPLRGDVTLDFLWHDVTAGLRGTYDFIVSNPPFHTGRAARTDLGQAFILAATKALKPGGRLFIVANQNLPYEATIAANISRHRIVATANGYKIIEAINIQAVSSR